MHILIIYIYTYIYTGLEPDPADVQALLGAWLSAGSLLTEIWICFDSSFGGFRGFRDTFTDQGIQNGRQNPKKYRGTSSVKIYVQQASI